MATILSFSSSSSLFSYLNIIFVGIVVFYAINRFYYLTSTIIYSISKTFIPIITALIFGSLLGTNFALSIGSIFISLILYFISGLIVIKIVEKIIDYFDSDTMIYFIIIFAIIDSIVTWLFSLIINLLF